MFGDTLTAAAFSAAHISPKASAPCSVPRRHRSRGGYERDVECEPTPAAALTCAICDGAGAEQQGSDPSNTELPAVHLRLPALLAHILQSFLDTVYGAV
jgi:hypothetical protein